MAHSATQFASTGVIDGEKDYTLDFDQAAGDGIWIDISELRSVSIHVKALSAGDSLVVQVSNAPTLDNTIDGVADQTINGTGSEQFVTMTKLPARGLKIDKTGSTGTAKAYVHGLSR
jgi:hypothetical protein